MQENKNGLDISQFINFLKLVIFLLFFNFSCLFIYGLDQNNKSMSVTCLEIVDPNFELKNNTGNFTIQCEFLSNIPANEIQIKSNNASKLLNSINSNLTPRPYTASYNISVFGDSLQNTVLDATTTILSTNYSILYDIETSTSPALKDKSIGVTVQAIFTIDDNTTAGDSLNSIYLGTYSDVISLKIIEI